MNMATIPIQKKDGLEIVTFNDCDWLIQNGHVKFDWPTIRSAKQALTLLMKLNMMILNVIKQIFEIIETIKFN